MVKLILVRGLPGSGKSTMARKMVADAPFSENICHLETDMFFEDAEGVYKFDPSKLKEAHAWCQRKAKQYLDMGYKVIVSNTFTQKWEAQPYLDMVDPSEAVILTANGEFGSVHSVPPESIQRMKARWEEF